MLGLPVLALADLPDSEPAHVFQRPSPGLAGRTVATTPEQFAVAVRRLVADAGLRRREGEEVHAAVVAEHDGDGWRAHLESLYAQARALPAVDVDELGESAVDDAYGAMLVSAWSATGMVSPDPVHAGDCLGELFDAGMRGDLFVASRVGDAGSVTVRVPAGWERHMPWTTRLVDLACTRPHVTVSLPFAADDDVEGSRSTALLVTALAELGRTPETCGDVSVESSAPGGHTVENLPFTTESLDWLAGVLASPLWDRALVPTTG
jgi:hypothetical protein